MTRHTLTVPVPGGEPPREFRIFPFGRVETTKGVFLFDRKAAERVMQAWRDYGNRLSIDYEHQALEPVSNGPVPAAGWFELELREDGLWAVNVEWTPKAAELLRNREYRYFSPAFYAEEGRIVELINLALTNLPATKRMEPLVAKAVGFESGPVYEGSSYHQWGEKAPWEREEGSGREKMTEILRLLGRESATEAEVAATVSRLVTLERTLTSLTGHQDLDQALAVVQGWRQAHEELPRVQERLAALEEERRRERLARLIEEGKREGKLTPAMLSWAEQQTPEALEAFLAVAPRVVRANGLEEPEPGGLDWHKMTPAERAELYRKDPEAYRALRRKALGY